MQIEAECIVSEIGWVFSKHIRLTLEKLSLPKKLMGKKVDSYKAGQQTYSILVFSDGSCSCS